MFNTLSITFNINEKKIIILVSKHKKIFRSKYNEEIAKHYMDDIKEKIKFGASPSYILILTRINSNVLLQNSLSLFAKKYRVLFSENNNDSKNRIRKISVHSSKGLESKYVYLLDITKGLYGFPCEIENLDIFSIPTLNEFNSE